MLKDVTLGQYYPVDSPLHKLDPRVKLFGTLVFIVSLFLAKNPVIYIIATIFLAVVLKLSKVPVKYLLRGLKPVLVIIVISLVFNLFLTDGQVIWSFWKFKITLEGIYQAVYMGIRMVFLIMGSSIVTYTTTPNRLADGLEKSLGFLKFIKVPVHEIAMMISIALRFIPILAEEAGKIMKAQQARGADFDTGNVFKKIKAMVPVIIPLFVSAIRRACDLATAMEARCYRGGKGRTKLNQLKYTGRDVMAYLIVMAYLALIILSKILWNRYIL